MAFANWTSAAEIERTEVLLGRLAEDQRETNLKEKKEPAALNVGGTDLNELFRFAGITRQERRKIALRLGVLSTLILLACLAVGKLWLLAGIPLLIWAEYRSLNRKRVKRAQHFERDYTALLLSLASGVRTGLDPLQALADSVELFQNDSTVRAEIQRLRDGIDAGLTEEQLLGRFADSIDHPDVKLFRTAFILARREGSSLAECLQRLARVTRQRQSFRRKIKGAVAMQKLSAYGIGACTIVIGIIQATTNPQATITALHHPLGFKLLVGGAALVVIGVAWMVALAKPRL